MRLALLAKVVERLDLHMQRFALATWKDFVEGRARSSARSVRNNKTASHHHRTRFPQSTLAKIPQAKRIFKNEEHAVKFAFECWRHCASSYNQEAGPLLQPVDPSKVRNFATRFIVRLIQSFITRHSVAPTFRVWRWKQFVGINISTRLCRFVHILATANTRHAWDVLLVLRRAHIEGRNWIMNQQKLPLAMLNVYRRILADAFDALVSHSIEEEERRETEHREAQKRTSKLQAAVAQDS